MDSKRASAIWTARSFGSELMEVTIGDLLDRQSERYGDRPAIVFDDVHRPLPVRWSYAQLRRNADRLAKGLVQLGVEQGDRVAVLSPNSPEWILLEYALAKLGAVLVTVNTACRAPELAYVLRQGRIRTLFTVDAHRGFSFSRTVQELVPELAGIAEHPSPEIASASFPDLRRIVLMGGGALDGSIAFEQLMSMSDAVSDAELKSRQARVSPGDVAQIQYTSGTTGAPKGAMLTHHGTVNNANLMGDRAGFTQEDRLISAMPLFHTAGCVCNVLGMLARGGTLIGMPVFDAKRMLELIETHRATVVNAVPTMFIRMMERPEFQRGQVDLSSVRIVFTGGTSIPPSFMRELTSRMDAEPMIIMGMTETSPLITQTIPADDFERKITTAGIPLPFTEIRIVDACTGEPVAYGQEGELLVRGYLLMKGYFDMPDRTAATIDGDGWLHSGDLATLDESGHLRIVGRIKDMIIRGGENLYPVEIEEFLLAHPSIAQAQVVGVPDPEMGEEAFAFLVLREGADVSERALRDYCASGISRHKIPRYIEFVSEFPLTSNGKVRKFELRELAAGIVGAGRKGVHG